MTKYRQFLETIPQRKLLYTRLRQHCAYTPNSPLDVWFCNFVSGLTSKRTELTVLR
jgi:hypothetical protein